MTSTRYVVGQWKEYFKDFLSPTATPSVEEAESKDPEIDSFIAQTEVQEAVQKLLSAEATRVDKICILPQISGCLAVLTHLCSIVWQLVTVPLDWQTRVAVNWRTLNTLGTFSLVREV